MNRSGRQREGVAVPVDTGDRVVPQSPVLRTGHRVLAAGGGQLDLSDAHLVRRPGGHLGTEDGGQLLGPQAHAEHRPARVHHLADQFPFGAQPPVPIAVVDPHGAAHHRQSGDRPVIGQGLPAVDPDHLVREAALGQRPGDEARSLVGDMLDDRPPAAGGRSSGRVRPGGAGLGAGHYPVATT